MFAIADAVMGVVKPLLDKWIPDANERLAAENLIANQVHSISLAQIEVNRAEAGSGSLWVAGWRPFVGWVCGASFAYALIVRHLLNWVFGLVGMFTETSVPILPDVDTAIAFELLVGMLGFGAMRSWEKSKGVASK